MRKVYLLCFLLFCAGLARAQKTKSYTSGLKAGANLYNLKVSDQGDVSNEMRINFHAGIFWNVPIASSFSINPEILYSSEGAKFSSTNNETETMLNYLSLPVMVQFNTSSGFYLETGPVLGIMVKGRETIKTSAATSELDLKKQFKKTNIQWGGGVGYKLDKFGFNARYNFGLSNLIQDGVTRNETKSNGFQVSFSWFFKQGK
jgi:hypothetical protein